MAEAGGHQFGRGAHLVAGLVALFACTTIGAISYRLNQGALLPKQPMLLNGTASVWDGDSLTVRMRTVLTVTLKLSTAHKHKARGGQSRCKKRRSGYLLLTLQSYNRRASTPTGGPTNVVRSLSLLCVIFCTSRNRQSLQAHLPGETGEAAAAALRALVGRTPLSCEVVRTDRYQRTVARCTRAATLFQRSVDLSMWLLENGHALVYRYSSSL